MDSGGLLVFDLMEENKKRTVFRGALPPRTTRRETQAG
jgi:hypothetical protein